MNLLKRDVMVLNKEISHAFTVILLGSTQRLRFNIYTILGEDQRLFYLKFSITIIFAHIKILKYFTYFSLEILEKDKKGTLSTHKIKHRNTGRKNPGQAQRNTGHN